MDKSPEPEPTLEEKLAALKQYLDEIPVQLTDGFRVIDSLGKTHSIYSSMQENSSQDKFETLTPEQKEIFLKLSPVIEAITFDEINAFWDSLSSKQVLRLRNELEPGWSDKIKGEQKYVGYRSTVDTTLNRAEQLAEFGKTIQDSIEAACALGSNVPPDLTARFELGKLLFTCAALLCATAHAQGLQTHFIYLIEASRLIPGTLIAGRELEDIYSRSVWEQTQKLPELKTNGRLHLAHHNFHVLRLRKLVSLRNKLLHVKDPVVIADGNNPVEIIGDLKDREQDIAAIFEVDRGNAKFVFGTPEPTDPWVAVTHKSVVEYIAAVRAYDSEVIRIEALDMVTSGLLEYASVATPL